MQDTTTTDWQWALEQYAKGVQLPYELERICCHIQWAIARSKAQSDILQAAEAALKDELTVLEIRRLALLNELSYLNHARLKDNSASLIGCI